MLILYLSCSRNWVQDSTLIQDSLSLTWSLTFATVQVFSLLISATSKFWWSWDTCWGICFVNKFVVRPDFNCRIALLVWHCARSLSSIRFKARRNPEVEHTNWTFKVCNGYSYLISLFKTLQFLCQKCNWLLVRASSVFVTSLWKAQNSSRTVSMHSDIDIASIYIRLILGGNINMALISHIDACCHDPANCVSHFVNYLDVRPPELHNWKCLQEIKVLALAKWKFSISYPAGKLTSLIWPLWIVCFT